MAQELTNFDLIVIGGGPAGIVGATTAAQLGKRVALVDSEQELGGAGTNTGTVPSKTLRETALALSGIRSRNLYGVDLSLRREATVADFLTHERHVKTGLNELLRQRMRTWNAYVVQGQAAFHSPNAVRVVQSGSGQIQLLQAEKILIATGSSPRHPAGFPFGCREIYDSDSILNLDKIPRSLAVIGAGVIGSEYASTFAALGAQVHVVDDREALLPFLDKELSEALLAAMIRSGIVFHWRERPESYTPEPSGTVTLTLGSGDRITLDAVLVASGRKSNTETLNLPRAGVLVGEHGLIAVDKEYRTNVPHIYAAGDVIGFPALASTSMEQARRAIRCAFEEPSGDRPLGQLPTGVYTIPEVGMAGETEESLRQAGVDYVVGHAPYANSARGRIIGDEDGFLKLIFRRDDGKLLGVHAIGEMATELVHIGLIALMVGGSLALFDETCFNIPTLGALYKLAALNAMITSRVLKTSST
jgi:NAD(P) transhydrogenase